MLQAYALQDARIQYVVNSRNLGVWPSYNVGVRKSRGRYIAIQDADDVSMPDRLQLLYDYLEQHPEVDVVGAGLRYIDEASGRELMCRRYPERAETAIKRYCPIAHGTTLRKACAHERYGYYSELPDVRHAADYELWCRWQTSGAVMHNHPAIVYHYQQSPLNFKANNVRAILRDTVRIKWRYARALRFSFGDYVYLTMESAAALLPASVIVWMFYRYNRIRAASSVE
jgi:glycosyltransferase involved in cell wall biosynthesis